MSHSNIIYINGVCDLGSIGKEHTDVLGCNDGPIRLLEGFQAYGRGYGLTHIEDNESRVKQLLGIGFSSVTSCVSFVAANFEYADMQEDGRLLIVAGKGTAFLHMALEWNDSFWSVVTLIPKRHKRDIKGGWSGLRPDESEPASGTVSSSPRFETLSLPTKLTGSES